MQYAFEFIFILFILYILFYILYYKLYILLYMYSIVYHILYILLNFRNVVISFINIMKYLKSKYKETILKCNKIVYGCNEIL